MCIYEHGITEWLRQMWTHSPKFYVKSLFLLIKQPDSDVRYVNVFCVARVSLQDIHVTVLLTI